MGSSAFANGGLLLKDIITPDWEEYTLDIKKPGSIVAQDTRELGNYIRDLFTLNKDIIEDAIFALESEYGSDYIYYIGKDLSILDEAINNELERL